MKTIDTEARLMEVMTSIKKLDLIIKKLFLEEEPSSSSSFHENLSIYHLILEAKSSKIMQLSDIELQILDLFAEHKAMTLNELKKRMKLSRKWVSEKCKNLCELGFLSCTLRKHKGKGRPFQIYHVYNASVYNLDRAEGEYLKIKNSFAPKLDTSKEEKKSMKKPKINWKCQNCGEVMKNRKMPRKCKHCGDSRFSIYDPKNVDQRGSISKNIVFG